MSARITIYAHNPHTPSYTPMYHPSPLHPSSHITTLSPHTLISHHHPPPHTPSHSLPPHRTSPPSPLPLTQPSSPVPPLLLPFSITSTVWMRLRMARPLESFWTTPASMQSRGARCVMKASLPRTRKRLVPPHTDLYAHMPGWGSISLYVLIS